jgi:hypothetical protein
MSDISNQLIKDSYNYVLQSDLGDGTVYRIGGTIPVNPKFLSGLTVNSGFTYSNGTEQNGYALLTDGTGYAYWGAVSAATPSSGVTSVTGTNGISVSPTTGNVVVSFTGTTSGGLEYFVTGATPTATQSGDRWFNTDTGVELVWIEDGDSNQWVQPFSVPGPLSPDVGYYATTGITTGQTLTWDKTYWGISGSSNVNLTLPTTTSKDGYYLIIKDEAGICGTFRIRITPDSGLIDGNNYIDMNINYMSLTCMVRGGNWYLI